MLLRLGTDSLEEIHDRSRDPVRIIGETGHGGRSPAHMHGHIGDLQFSQQFPHRIASSADIVDNESSDQVIDLPDYSRPESIH